MAELDKIAALLHSEAPEKQVAAAIVIGEIKATSPAVTQGLLAMLDSPIPPVRRHALDAFSQLGVAKVIDHVFPLLTSRDTDVREAAIRAIVSVGDKVVPKVKGRLKVASSDEKRSLELVLAQLGGKEALATILANLHQSDEESAKAVALEVRRQVKDADPKTRRTYLTQVLKFLKNPKTQQSMAALSAAIKILGFLEQPNTMVALLPFATQSKWGLTVREEALTALRFVKASKSEQAKLAQALLEVAEEGEAPLARAALLTLGNLELGDSVAQKLGDLATHTELERARFAIEQLGRQDGPEALKVLVSILSVQDRTRAELAGDALKKRKEAAPLLARALEKIEDPDRAWLMQKVLRPNAAALDKATRLRLVEAAVDHLAAGKRGWEAQLQVVRDADPGAVAEALRELTLSFMKAKKPDRAMMVARVLCRSDQASQDDRFLCAALELANGRYDTHPSARARDAALKSIAQLMHDGFDVPAAIKKSKLFSPDALYYVGFHFAEEGHPLGEELLGEVVAKAGRSKLGKMAKNKLDLAMKEA